MDNIDSPSEQSDSNSSKASNKQEMLDVPLKDAVNKFYKLKSEYDANYNKMKTRIIRLRSKKVISMVFCKKRSIRKYRQR